MFGRKTDDFPPTVKLTDLDGSNGFRIDGVEPGDQSGWAVSSLGDINGDGIDDVIIGAGGADPDDNRFAGSSQQLRDFRS